jgi:site-specific recombinase XerD
LDGFAAHLQEEGYCWWTTRSHVNAAAHLGLWTKTIELGVDSLNEKTLLSFEEHLSSCACLSANIRASSSGETVGARHFLRYLRDIGAVTSRNDQKHQPHYSPLHQGFRQWMREHRGVKERTLEIYAPTVADLLHTIGENPQEYNIESLRSFVFSRLKQSSRVHAKKAVTAVRMFLRYLAAHGLCMPYLDEAIPRLAHWRLSDLPRYLESEDIEEIISCCDTSTPVGRRDRAILLLIARLGLRGGDIASLRLEDIDWTEASIRVTGKGRRQTRLPLPQQVGDAILQYLQFGRPPVNDDHVFITAIAPLHPLGSGSRVSCIVARAIRRAGIKAPTHGAHVLRHSAATAMLRQGMSLNGIAAILRHKSIETTIQYAKVDISLLKEIAQPWPEVETC